MEILQVKNDIKFIVDNEFHINYLSPIAKYVHWKLENEWDDYNELYHAVKLVENLKNKSNIWFETHTLVENEEVKGVLLIVGGKIDKVENKYLIEDPSHSLLLKYFHIIKKGMGLGTFWLNSVIIPYYSNKGFKHLYINSSHKKSFPFYQKFGQQIATYQQNSDNKVYSREGSCFKVKIG